MDFKEWLSTEEGRLVTYYPSTKEMCQRCYEAGQRNAAQTTVPKDFERLMSKVEEIVGNPLEDNALHSLISGYIKSKLPQYAAPPPAIKFLPEAAEVIAAARTFVSLRPSVNIPLTNAIRKLDQAQERKSITPDPEDEPDEAMTER